VLAVNSNYIPADKGLMSSICNSQLVLETLFRLPEVAIFTISKKSSV
jgi:hypothetical protein